MRSRPRSPYEGPLPPEGPPLDTLAAQFAPQGNQAERSESEQGQCRAAIRHTSGSNLKREVLVRSSPPRPYVGAGRHAEACEGRVVKGHRFLEIARVLVRFNHVACDVNADHGIV
jgi:hypothetical protein